jgi:hypothetical protein
MRNGFKQSIQTAVDRLLDVEPENDTRDNIDMLFASVNICLLIAAIIASPFLISAIQVEEGGSFFIYSYAQYIRTALIVGTLPLFIIQKVIAWIGREKYQQLKEKIANWLRREQIEQHIERIQRAFRQVQQEQASVSWKRLSRESNQICLPAPESAPFLLFAHRQAPLRIP